MNGPQGSPNPQGVPPEVEARLRDPRHPVHHGLVLHPVPNLIVTRSTPRYGERHLRMSWWMAKTVVFVHYTRMQKLLYFGGLIVLILMWTVIPLLLFADTPSCVFDMSSNGCPAP
ncbi:hypothetical protein [Glycomyces sp. NPDC021274]|uniref:hypothetical protein n=1 Tax=Glycomyces sp. NPDC021274 TaxID=3155120 RepID=UPI0033D23698